MRGVNMKKERNMKEEIKVNVDVNNIRKSAINSRIYRYAWTRYINITNEERLIKDILESCKEDDNEIKEKYLKKLEKIQIEEKLIFNELKNIDEKDMEK